MSPAPATNDRIVWIDCEMTGLDLVADALVEVAVVVTDSELTVLDDGIDVIIRPPDEALEQMVPFVREMHTRSGLLDALPDGLTMAEATTVVMEYLRGHVEAGKAPLGGNSVGTDKAFLDRDMPDVDRAPALPGHRRLVDQGARPPLVPADLLRLTREGGRSPCSGGHPREHRRAAVLPRRVDGAPAGPGQRRGQEDRRRGRRDEVPAVLTAGPSATNAMGWLTGLEPATPWTTTRCSTN